MMQAPFVAPGLAGPEFQFQEFQIMANTTFKMLKGPGGTIRTLWGREVSWGSGV